jgi:hypothetical protein
MSLQLGHSYTSCINTDHILAPIRRLRAELTNLLTQSVDNVNKCSNVNCPSNKKTDLFVISGKVGQNTENAGKKALSRRKSCPAGHNSNIAISRPKHSSQHKVRVILFLLTITRHFFQRIIFEYSGQKMRSHHKESLHSTLSFPHILHHPHSQLSRRHSDMTVVRRQEVPWDRRARSSFLSGDAAEEDHEEHNEVARSMWSNKIERRTGVNSFRHHG